MRDYKSLKTIAIGLRKKGRSYKEILTKVPVSKSSLSLWLRDIPLTQAHKTRLHAKTIAVLKMGHTAMKAKRTKEIEQIKQAATQEIPKQIGLIAYKLLGAGLYWAEGAKTVHFAVTNSDPLLIQFMVRWIQDILGIPPKSLQAHLNIYPQQNENKIKQFWSQKTGIPLRNFGKSFVKPMSTGYKKNILYNGTIRIRVPRGTDYRHRIFGWIKKVLINYNIVVEKPNTK